jgi:hypothetical protein
LLRAKADQEARLLLAAYAHDGTTSLPQLCVRLSLLFNQVKDMTVAQLPATPEEYAVLLRTQLPPLLQALPDLDVRLARVPAAYQNRMVATALTSCLVYGCDMAVVDMLLTRGQTDAAIRFYRAQKAAESLAAELSGRDELVALLKALPTGVVLATHSSCT